MDVLTYEGLKTYHENNEKLIKKSISAMEVEMTGVEKSEINGNLKINGVKQLCTHHRNIMLNIKYRKVVMINNGRF